MAHSGNPGTRGYIANPGCRPRDPAVHERSPRDPEQSRGRRRRYGDRDAIPASPYRGLCGLYRDAHAADAGAASPTKPVINANPAMRFLTDFIVYLPF